MKTYVGFIFTQTPIQNLKERGFLFQETENNLTQGYRAFTLTLPGPDPSPVQIQLRQVID